MFQIKNIERIIRLFEEYKTQYNKPDIIGILPMPIKELSSEYMAYTNNDELMNCIKNLKNVTLYYNKKLFSNCDEYIKAVLFHEFTHISDAYNFVGLNNPNTLMTTYSEFNAKKIEILVKCNGKVPLLDDAICDEGGTTTPREEIQNYLDMIVNISKTAKLYSDKIQERKAWLWNSYIKSYSWMFAYLSFFENTQQKYFDECFEKLDIYGQKTLAKNIYKKIQNLEDVKENPQQLISDVLDLYYVCFE